MQNKVRERFDRVDVQVSLFMACVVTISALCVFAVGYTVTYNDMLNSLRERVYSLYSLLEEEMDKSTFSDINTKEDIQKDTYREMKELFYQLKKSTGVQYLYTAKRSADGELIYVIDGLSDDAVDFRYPGDAIEGEIVGELERALAGEEVLPNDIKHTAWGNIFIAYMPIHAQDGNVVGAIGIEFVAEHQYLAYQFLRRVIPIMILVVCIVCVLLAVLFFRRISNPSFQDLSTTDYLTGLKNRNAYEFETQNIIARRSTKGMGIIMIDLNGLKKVNDTHGHAAGDRYIKLLADAMRETCTDGELLYRVGGDEFVVLVKDTETKTFDSLITQLETRFHELTGDDFPEASFASGKVICAGEQEKDFKYACQLADVIMYENKSEHYHQRQTVADTSVQ